MNNQNLFNNIIIDSCEYVELNEINPTITTQNEFDEIDTQGVINYELSNINPSIELMTGGSIKLYEKLSDITTNASNKFKIKTRTVEFKPINNAVNDFIQANKLTQQFINEICNDYVKPLKSKTNVKIIIDHNSFMFPIQLPFIKKEELTPDIIWSRFDQLIQSRKKDQNYTHDNNGKVTVTIKIVESVQGGSRPRRGQPSSQTKNTK